MLCSGLSILLIFMKMVSLKSNAQEEVWASRFKAAKTRLWSQVCQWKWTVLLFLIVLLILNNVIIFICALVNTFWVVWRNPHKPNYILAHNFAECKDFQEGLCGWFYEAASSNVYQIFTLPSWSHAVIIKLFLLKLYPYLWEFRILV